MCWAADGFAFRLYGVTDVSTLTDPPSGRFFSVAAGASHTCALRETGEIACWGANTYGQSAAPPDRYRAVSAGDYQTCAQRESGEIECWGYQFDGQPRPPAGKQLAVSVGGRHACALSEAGAAYCWIVYDGAADVPIWLRDLQAEPALARGRIVARRLSDGRTEFGWLPAGSGERVLPRLRYAPADAEVGRWLRSSPVEVGGEKIGRISARRLSDGRIEYAFSPINSERILPTSRILSAQPAPDRWLHSSEIAFSGSDP